MGFAWAIVGLGNPGWQYAATRHNVGFMVVEELCRRWHAALDAAPGEYTWARITRDDTPVTLMQPVTYMNGSGSAVRDLLERTGVAVDRCIIVSDDVALPIGTLRLRRRGSDGGHKGLQSIIYQLGSEEIPRLRCGIGPVPEGMTTREFVLMEFSGSERDTCSAMVQRAADGIEWCLTRGFDDAMTRFNT